MLPVPGRVLRNVSIMAAEEAEVFILLRHRPLALLHLHRVLRLPHPGLKYGPSLPVQRHPGPRSMPRSMAAHGISATMTMAGRQHP